MDEVTFRRRSNHESQNLSAGYVPVDDEYLQQTGVRGKRSCCLAFVVIFLLLTAVANALVTAGLVFFMNITHVGMQDLEFVPGGQLIRVLSDCYVGQVVTQDGMIGGRVDQNMVITGQQVSLSQSVGTGFSVDDEGVHITSQELRMETSDGEAFFTLDSDLHLPPHVGVNLHSSQAEVQTISSHDHYMDLYLEASLDLELVGNEGVVMGAEGDINVRNTNNILINPVDGDLVIEGTEGVELTPDLPIASQGAYKGYKLCICMSTGQVFAVPVVDDDSGCHKANEDVNPCEE